MKPSCKECNGTGHGTPIYHGIHPWGEDIIESVKCESCDGFGTEQNMKPSELLELCMEFDAPDFAVFFSYSSHTKGIAIGIHEHGWVSGQAASHYHTYYLDNPMNGETQDAADLLRKQHEEFRSKQ